MFGWGKRAPEGEPKTGMPNVGKAERAVLAGFGAVSLANAEGDIVTAPQKEKTVDVSYETSATPESKEGREQLKDWDVFFNFLPFAERDSKGNIVSLSWKDALHPAMLGISKENTQPATVSVTVPYEFARFFNVGEPVSAEDYEKLNAYIKHEVLEQTAENIYGLLDGDEDFYKDHLQQAGAEGIVKSITVVGEASPESHTVDSIIPGNIEDENLGLAELRAQDADMHTRQVLEELGFTVPENSRILSAESQLTAPEEFGKLHELALNAGKEGSPEEMVYKLVADYNKGKITDSDVSDQLDEIIASKRKVEVEIDLEDGTRDTLLLPGFLMYALALAPMLRRRKKESEQPGPKSRERIVDVPPPKEGKDANAFVRDIAVDLFKNFSFYEGVIGRYRKDADPDVNEITHDVLKLWTDNDNEIRAKAGLPPEVDHASRPRQVFYANLHARALRQVILGARKEGVDASQAFGAQDTRDAITKDLYQEIDRLRALEKSGK